MPETKRVIEPHSIRALYEFWTADMTKCYALRMGHHLKSGLTTGMTVGSQKVLKFGSILCRVR